MTATASEAVSLGPGLELRWAHVNDLFEQDLNARTMKPEMFQRLQQTIGRDKRLESLPFCAQTEKGVEIVSGHHRVRAARAAGVDTIPVIVDTTGLTKAQIKAKQLAHNAIAGYDDPDMLARIYQEIDDMEARLEAFIDEALIEPPPGPVPAPGMSLSIEHRTAVVAFLPYQAERFAAAVEALAATLSADEVYLADLEKLDEFRELVATMRKHFEVRALGGLLSTVAGIVNEKLGIDDGEQDGWRALVDLGGGKTAMLPPDAADTIDEAIARVRKETKEKSMPAWRALQLLAERYLGRA